MDSDGHTRSGRTPARRRVRALAIVVVLIGLGAWAWFARRPTITEENARSTSTTEGRADSGPDADLAAGGGRSAAGAEHGVSGPESSAVDGLDPSSMPLAPSGVIVGFVVDERGVPLPGIRVDSYAVRTRVDRGETHVDLAELGGGATDAQGRFRWKPQLPRPCWVRVNAERAWRSDAVEATPGGRVVRLVALHREATRLLVLDAKGAPVRDVGISTQSSIERRYPRSLASYHANDWPTAVVADDLTPFSVRTDGNGRAECPIPDRRARIVLDVVPPRDRGDLLPLHDDAWSAPPEATIRLQAGLRTHGTVVDLKGRPVTSGLVRYTPRGGTPGIVKVEFDGTFDVPVLAPGPVDLLAFDPSILSPPERRPIVVAVGTTDALLMLDVGGELLVRVANRAPGAGGTVRLTVDGSTEAGRGQTSVTLENDGTAVLRGVRDDERYVLWIAAVERPRSSDDGADAGLTGSVYRTGITTRDSPLSVEETTGKTLEVEVVVGAGQQIGPARIAERGVLLYAPFFAAAESGSRTLEGERRLIARFSGLPDGAWSVSADGTDATSDAELAAVGTGKAGGSLRLVLGQAKSTSK